MTPDFPNPPPITDQQVPDALNDPEVVALALLSPKALLTLTRQTVPEAETLLPTNAPILIESFLPKALSPKAPLPTTLPPLPEPQVSNPAVFVEENSRDKDASEFEWFKNGESDSALADVVTFDAIDDSSALFSIIDAIANDFFASPSNDDPALKDLHLSLILLLFLCPLANRKLKRVRDVVASEEVSVSGPLVVVVSEEVVAKAADPKDTFALDVDVMFAISTDVDAASSAMLTCHPSLPVLSCC